MINESKTRKDYVLIKADKGIQMYKCPPKAEQMLNSSTHVGYKKLELLCEVTDIACFMFFRVADSL